MDSQSKNSNIFLLLILYTHSILRKIKPHKCWLFLDILFFKLFNSSVIKGLWHESKCIHLNQELFLGFLFCSINLCLFLWQSILFWLPWPFYSSRLGSVIPPVLFFFLRIAVAMQGLLWFHINFWNVYSSSVKYVIGILKGIALNL